MFYFILFIFFVLFYFIYFILFYLFYFIYFVLFYLFCFILFILFCFILLKYKILQVCGVCVQSSINLRMFFKYKVNWLGDSLENYTKKVYYTLTLRWLKSLCHNNNTTNIYPWNINVYVKGRKSATCFGLRLNHYHTQYSH